MLSAVFLSSSAHAVTMTLSEAFDAAMRQSENVAITKESIEQAEARIWQAQGHLWPQIFAEGQYFRQDPPASTIFGRSERYQTRINGSQTLFSGLREFSALKGFRAQRRAGQADFDQAAALLYRDVARSFYGLVSADIEISDIDDEIRIYDDRVKELQQRLRIGRSRASEKLAIESAQARLRADRQGLLIERSTQVEIFRFLTGLSDVTPNDQEPLPLTPPDVNQFLTALDRRPDVRAEVERYNAAHQAVHVAQADHYPTLNATGNYYPIRTNDLNDLHKDPTWDVQGTITLPLFSGGTVVGQVREKKSQRLAQDLKMREIKRMAEQEIRTIFERLRIDLDQLQALKVALELSQQDYKAQTREYRLGLVTNLDVLQALVSEQQNRRDYNKAIYAAKLDRVLLEIASAFRTTPPPNP